MAQGQSRKVFLDRLRVTAACAVVLLHTVTGVKDTVDMNLYPMEQRIFLAVLDMVTWCVPVFIMISGYLFLNPGREFTMKQMLIRYCRRIILALFLFGVPYACVELAVTERTVSLSTVGRGVMLVLQGKSWSHMWYLYLILLLYLVTPGIRWILKKVPRWMVILSVVLLFMGSSAWVYVSKVSGRETDIVLPDFCIYVFYYLCGYLFARRGWKRRGMAGAEALICDSGKTDRPEKKKAGIPRWVLPTVIFLLAFGMVLSRLWAMCRLEMAYAYPFTVLLSVLVFAWAARADIQTNGLQDEQLMGLKNVGGTGNLIVKAGHTLPWRRMGELSFTVYLIHPVFVNFAYKFLHVTPLAYPLWWSLPVFWLLILLLSAISAWVLYQIPVLRKYVL